MRVLAVLLFFFSIVPVVAHGEFDNEFLRLMSTKLKDAQTEEELLEAFNVFDSVGRGQFGKQELKEVSERLKCNFAKEDIEEMIAVADLNGDQLIDFDEFVRIMLTQE